MSGCHGVPRWVRSSRVGSNPLFAARPDHLVNRLALSPTQKIPKGQVDAAQGHHRDAFAPVGQRRCVQRFPDRSNVFDAVHGATHQKLAEVAVDDLHRGHAATTVSKPDHAGVGLDPNDDLPEVGPPGCRHVLVVGVDGADVGDFHGTLPEDRGQPDGIGIQLASTT